SRTTPDNAVPPALADHPKYRVIRRLGTGGMGSVWLAEHTVMNRQVAVKVIRPDLLAKPGATERFLREVRAAAKLHHPNIVTAFDAEPVGDSCLLVMEYVPGETLGDRVKAGPMPVAEACRAARDAARGLAHAHAAVLVHRDVKPHNLIRAADGTTKVLDFGLAGVAAGESIAQGGTGLTGAGMVVGTPDYIAPEQATDPHTADARADIYGLGCTFYHLLAGRPPVPEGSIMEKLDAQKTRDPDPIPGMAAGVALVLARMIAKRPEDRYQTADEGVAALQTLIHAECSTAPSPSRPRRRWRTLVAAAALAAAICLVGAIIYVETDKGDFVIETNDKDIAVMVNRQGVKITDIKTGREYLLKVGTQRVRTGEYVVVPQLLTEDIDIKGEHGTVFTIKRGGQAVATAKLRAKSDPPDIARSEREMFLGTWRVVAGSVRGRRMTESAVNGLAATATFLKDNRVNWKAN